MAKRKDSSTASHEESEVGGSSEGSASHKKHKKHKHRKHKKRRGTDDEARPDGGSASSAPPANASTSDGVKLKIKLGFSSGGDGEASASSTPSTPKASQPGRKRKRAGASSDEERWLDAIESGNLAEVDDELRKMKDPKLMTARQRALMGKKDVPIPPPPLKGILKPTLSAGLPPRAKVPKFAPPVEETEEDMEVKKALKSEKRRQMAAEKKEKDKRKTMDRLLKKQESKAAKAVGKSRLRGKEQPKITYTNNNDGVTITMPAGKEFPLQAKPKIEPPAPQLCGVIGCGQKKRYNCSRTGVPLCSLQCYKTNLKAHTQIICS